MLLIENFNFFYASCIHHRGWHSIFRKNPVPSTTVTTDYCMATNSGEDTLAVLKHLTMQTNRMMNYQNSLALHKILPMMITNKLLKIKGVLCVQVKIEVCHNYKP